MMLRHISVTNNISAAKTLRQNKVNPNCMGSKGSNFKLCQKMPYYHGFDIQNIPVLHVIRVNWE